MYTTVWHTKSVFKNWSLFFIRFYNPWVY